MKHSCPHCGQACMSSLQKIFLGPGSPVSCKSCGMRVSIRWRHALVLLIPAVLAMIVMKILELTPLQILPVGLMLIVVAALLQLWFVPLAKARDGQ